MLKKYLKNTSGNFGIMFGITAAMLALGVAAAVDVSGMFSQKSTLQGLSDSALLAASSSGEEDLEVLKEIVEKHLAANNFDNLEYRWNLDIVNGEAQLSVYSMYDTKMMGIAGKDRLNVDAFSASPIGGGGLAALNISLVLDSTGSMEGANMAALKSAATDMVDNVETSGGDVHFSVVPFGTYVNVGLENRNETWLDVPEDYHKTRTRRDVIDEGVCTETTETRLRDGRESTRTRRHCPDATYGP